MAGAEIPDYETVGTWTFYSETDCQAEDWLLSRIQPHLVEVGLEAADVTTDFIDEDIITALLKALLRDLRCSVNLIEEDEQLICAWVTRGYVEAALWSEEVNSLALTKSKGLSVWRPDDYPEERQQSDLARDIFCPVETDCLLERLEPVLSNYKRAADARRTIAFHAQNACMWGWHKTEAWNGLLLPTDQL